MPAAASAAPIPSPDLPAPQPLIRRLQRVVTLWSMLLLVFWVVFGVLDFQRVSKQRQDSAQRLANVVGNAVDTKIQKYLQGLEALQILHKSTAPSQSLEGHYALAMAFDQAFDTPIALIDEQQILLNSRRPLGAALPPVPNPPPPGRWAIGDAFASGQPQFGNLMQSPVFRIPTIPLAVPFVEGQKKLAWLVLLWSNAFDQPLQTLDVPAGWSVTLLDGNGQIIAKNWAGPDYAPGASGARNVAYPAASGHWSVAVQIDRWTFYGPAIQSALLRFAVLIVILASGIWYARRSAADIRAALNRLIYKPRLAATADDAAPRIAEFEQARAEMQRLDAAQHMAHEAERRRVARELHDGLQQNLAALQIDLDLVIQNVKADQSSQAVAMAEKARDVTAALVEDLHGIVNDLRPRVLDDFGLKAALEQLADQFTHATHIGVEVEVIDEASEISTLPQTLTSAIYRVAQECLNNVRRHSQAGFVYIVLDLSDSRRLLLQVSDDGVGIQPTDDDKPESHGLRSMAERVGALGGSLHIRPSDLLGTGTGTTVIAQVPLGA